MSDDKKQPKLLEAHDVAEMLNVKLSTVYTWVLEGYLPAIKLGKLVRFKLDEVLDWIEDNRVEIEDEEEDDDYGEDDGDEEDDDDDEDEEEEDDCDDEYDEEDDDNED